MTNKEAAPHYRTTARVVGVVYLAGFVVGMVGIMLIQSILGTPHHLATVSANSLMLAIGASLWLLPVAGDVAHGVLMFPLLKQHSERLAIGHLAARIIDATFIAVMVLFVLVQIPLGSEYLKAAAPDAAWLQSLSTLLSQTQLYAYEIGMSALGLAGLMLCYTLYQTRLIPRWLALWGLVGYAIILGGMVSAIMGSGLGDIASIAGGLWEMAIGVWLIAKGFSASAFVSQAARTSHPAEALAGLPEPAKA